MLNPGLTRETATSKPKIPIFGSYFIPGISMCSKIPNEKFPKLSKEEFLIWFPFASKSRFSNGMASFKPVFTATPIGSTLRTPQTH